MEPDGSLLIRFDKNGFEVNPFLFKRHPDKSALIVEDLRGTEVFRASYDNPRLLRVRGKITIGPRVVDIPGLGIKDSCFSHFPNAFAVTY